MLKGFDNFKPTDKKILLVIWKINSFQSISLIFVSLSGWKVLHFEQEGLLHRLSHRLWRHISVVSCINR